MKTYNTATYGTNEKICIFIMVFFFSVWEGKVLYYHDILILAETLIKPYKWI